MSNTQTQVTTRKVSYLWLLTGRQEISTCQVPATDRGTTTADCHYHDVIDLRTGHVVGTAIDSSTDVTPVGEAVTAVGTTFFTITTGPQRGTIAIRGLGVIAPQPIPNSSFSFQGVDLVIPEAPVSHFAAIPAIAGANGVLSATGDFAGAEGRVALFGQLDLSQPGTGAFNCVFHLQLELPA